MNIEKVGPIEKGKQKISDKAEAEPDSEAFQEMMKVGLTREVDLDEQSGRKLKRPIEEKEELTSSKAPPPIYYSKKQTEQISPFERDDKTYEAPMKSDSSPESKEFYSAAAKKKLPQEMKEMEYLVDKELKKTKKHVVNKPAEPKTKTLEKEPKLTGKRPTLSHERAISEEGEQIRQAELHAKKLKAKHPEKLKKEEKPSLEKMAGEHPEKKKTEKKEDIETSVYQTIQPSEIALNRAEAIIAKEPSQLNPEIVPILEHMIGALVQFSDKDVSVTQIILNNKQFENSRFYNSKIIFEKYATAPHSYNIKLTGSQEAVTIFNENIEGLYKKLSQGDLEFEVGQLTAEYERPLFKRKAPVGDFDRDTKSR